MSKGIYIRTKSKVRAKESPQGRKPQAKPLSPKPRNTKQSLSLEQKLDLLVRSIVEEFPNDPTFPKLGFSFLPNCNQFYISIIRYKDTFGRGGYVVLKAQTDSFEEGLELILSSWKRRLQPVVSASSLIREGGF